MPVVALAPAAVISAFMALLFVLAWSVWGPAFNKMLSGIRIPGLGVIGDIVNAGISLALSIALDALEGIYQILLNLLDGAIKPAVDFVDNIVYAVDSQFGAVADFAQQTTDAIIGLTAHVIPGGIAALSDTLAQQVGAVYDAANGIAQNVASLEAQLQAVTQGAATSITNAAHYYTDTQIAALRTSLVDLINHAGVDLTGVGGLVHSQISAALGLVDTAITGAIGTSEGFATDLFQTAEADIAAALSTAEGYADSIAATLGGISATDIDQAISGALAGIYTDVDAAIDGAITAAGTGDIDIVAGLRAIPRVIPLDIAGLATLAGATTLALTRYLSECGIPNCNNLSQYGKDLQNLLGLVGDASFVALLVELIHHPSEAAQTVHDTFGGAIDAGTGLTRELLGV